LIPSFSYLVAGFALRFPLLVSIALAPRGPPGFSGYIFTDNLPPGGSNNIGESTGRDEWDSSENVRSYISFRGETPGGASADERFPISSVIILACCFCVFHPTVFSDKRSATFFVLFLYFFVLLNGIWMGVWSHRENG
jgi:hypothetical protein